MPIYATKFIKSIPMFHHKPLTISMLLSCFAAVILAFNANAHTGAGDAALALFKNELKANLNSDVLKEHNLNKAAVLVTFTVTAENSIHIINLASHEQPVKAYIAAVLEGQKIAAGLQTDEVYQILIRFERL